MPCRLFYPMTILKDWDVKQNKWTTCSCFMILVKWVLHNCPRSQCPCIWIVHELENFLVHIPFFCDLLKFNPVSCTRIKFPRHNRIRMHMVFRGHNQTNHFNIWSLTIATFTWNNISEAKVDEIRGRVDLLMVQHVKMQQQVQVSLSCHQSQFPINPNPDLHQKKILSLMMQFPLGQLKAGKYISIEQSRFSNKSKHIVYLSWQYVISFRKLGPCSPCHFLKF